MVHTVSRGAGVPLVGPAPVFPSRQALRRGEDQDVLLRTPGRWYRAGGVHPFALGYDADKTSPGMFLASPKFTIMWTRDKEAQA